MQCRVITQDFDGIIRACSLADALRTILKKPCRIAAQEGFKKVTAYDLQNNELGIAYPASLN